MPMTMTMMPLPPKSTMMLLMAHCREIALLLHLHWRKQQLLPRPWLWLRPLSSFLGPALMNDAEGEFGGVGVEEYYYGV